MGQPLSRRSDYGGNAACGLGTSTNKKPRREAGLLLDRKEFRLSVYGVTHKPDQRIPYPARRASQAQER